MWFAQHCILTHRYIFFRTYFCPSNIDFLFFNRFLQGDLDDAELEVDFLPGKEVARVEFYSALKHRELLLCRLHLKTPTQGTVRSVSRSGVF